ncbi:MAG TPA: hypothetical protein VFD86_00275 [Nitrospira sp.]|nr:hypothetical protein [Nitrospira sp.]
MGTKPVSLQWGQAGVPSTHDGRVVLGIMAIQAAFQLSEVLVLSSGETEKKCGMNEDQNEPGA